MKPFYAIISLLVLIACLIIPASASVYAHVTDLNTSANIYYSNGFDLKYVDITKFTEIGRVDTWAMCATFSSGSLKSGTFYGDAKYGGNIKGNYQATWSGGVSGMKAPFNMQIIFSNQTATGASGEQVIHLEGLYEYVANGDSANIFPSGSVFTLASVDPSPYATLFFCDGATRYASSINTMYAGDSTNLNTTFSISDSSDFATKLSGVQITISNGQTETTNALGEASIGIFPFASTYTYSLVKTGYTTKLSQPLGGYGETGGTLYDTMDPDTGFLPAGYIRTTVHTIDALTGSQISGTTINLRDVENNSWINSTADADGELIIDVLESHTLDVYGSYPGVFTASQDLGTAPGKDYYLPMYAALPTPADGYVNVLTYVTSAVDDGPIGSATVTYTYLDGTLKGQKIQTITDSWGASLAVLKNATVVVIDVSKPNYNGQSASHTLPNFADVMYTFRLSKGGMITAVPTVTDPATGAVITAVPTYLPYCDPSRGDYDEALCGHSKDNALFGQLRDSGDAIIGLCILAIIFGLLKMIMKF